MLCFKVWNRRTQSLAMSSSMGLLIGLLLSVGVGCSSNPHKAEEVDSRLKHSEDVGDRTKVGLNDSGEVVASRKVKLADQLRDLQQDVYEMEYEIYGNEKLGRKGIFGVLRECYDKSGELKRMPAKSILTKGEDKFNGKMAVDETKSLVNISDEYFLDRIKRFEGYKEGYESQKEDFEEKLRICKNQTGKSGESN